MMTETTNPCRCIRVDHPEGDPECTFTLMRAELADAHRMASSLIDRSEAAEREVEAIRRELSALRERGMEDA